MSDLKPEWLSKSQASEILNVSIASFERGVKRGTLPQPFYVTPRTPRWEKAVLIKHVRENT